MELCDQTLEEKIKMQEGFDKSKACIEFCSGLDYLHKLKITHRDLKPSNILFKGNTLKIADMGQSRILEMGKTAIETGSLGGTLGWMSPEEIDWQDGGSIRGKPFEARLSGDIHSGGSIIFYMLTDGKNCFGQRSYEQQNNIKNGDPIHLDILNDQPIALDLVGRMTLREPKKRLTIKEVLEHPFFWNDTMQINKIRDWNSSWSSNDNIFRKRISQHSFKNVPLIVGSNKDGWKGSLHPAVRKYLDSRKDNYYDGKNLKDLIRAIRNINEHWFDKNEKLDDNEQQLRKEALECFNYAPISSSKNNIFNSNAAVTKEMKLSKYFLQDRFRTLLLIFHNEYEFILHAQQADSNNSNKFSLRRNNKDFPSLMRNNNNNNNRNTGKKKKR